MLAPWGYLVEDNKAQLPRLHYMWVGVVEDECDKREGLKSVQVHVLVVADDPARTEQEFMMKRE